MRLVVVALVMLLATSAHAEPEGNTLSVQLQGAGIGVAIGGGIGALIGYGAGGKDKAPAAAGGAAAGAIFGLPIGLQKYADSRGGTGHAWGTVLGALIGWGAATANIVSDDKKKNTTEKILTDVVVMALCVTAGPIIGYRATEDKVVTTPIMMTFSF